jgi:hypothetical protein
MSRLLTGDIYRLSAVENYPSGPDHPMLFDEGSMLALDRQQQAREQFVRSRLSTPSTPVSHSSATVSLGDCTRNEFLQRQIIEIRNERQRILSDSVRQIQSYMDQLRREHAAHAKEMRELREADARLNERFLTEVEELKTKHKNQTAPMDEIIRRVKSKIAEAVCGDGKLIESIHVTDVTRSPEPKIAT